MNFLALFSGLKGFLNPSRLYAWASIAFVALAASVLAWQAGYVKGYDHAEALGTASVATLEKLHAKAMAAAELEARTRLQKAQTRIAELAYELHNKTNELKDSKHALKQASKRVTTVYVSAPGAAPQALPVPVFTWGFVRLWNDAVGANGASAAGVSPAGCSTRTATTTDTSEAAHAGVCDDLSPSGLTQEDLLHWIADYGERSQAIEAKLRTLQTLTPEF